MRNLFLALLFLFIPFLGQSQTAGDYRSRATGNWTAATTWQVYIGGTWQNLEAVSAGIYRNIIPSSASGAIGITNNVTISTSVSADQVTISSGAPVISATGSLTIADGQNDDLTISGTGTLTATGSLVISNDATYVHNRNGGIIPLATWGSGSTCRVVGILNTSPSLNPSSNYSNFVWNCAQTGAINLAGNLRKVSGDLTIEETNGNVLQFATSTSYTLDINGDFSVAGNSRIAFGTTTGVFTVNVLGNFDYSSSSGTASTLKSTGTCHFSVAGDFSFNSGAINFSSGANTTTFNIGGNFMQSPGTTLTESSSGSGVLNFNGTGGVQSITAWGTILNTVDFRVSGSVGVILSDNLSVPSAFIQNSGDVDLNGFRLTVNGNFAQSSGVLAVNTTSEFILQGNGTLPAGGIAFGGSDLGVLEINQTGTFTTSSTITITNLNLFNGIFTATDVSISDGGIVHRSAGSMTNTPGAAGVYDVLYSNAVAINTGPELPTVANVLNNLTKQGSGITTLNQSQVIAGGDFTLTAGTFDGDVNSISVGGNYVSNAPLTTSAGATFIFTGSSSSLVGAVLPTFRNLIIDGNFTPLINYTVNENYTVNSGASVSPGTALVNFNGTTVFTNNGTANLGAVTLASGSNFTAPATTLGIGGNLVITGGGTPATFTNNGGTILFNGTTVLSGNATPKTFNNVTVSGSLSSAVAWVVNGALTNNGTLSFTGATTFGGASGTISGSGTTALGAITISTGASLVASSPYSMSGAFSGIGNFASTSTVTFAGTTSMTGAGTKNFVNIIVNNGASFSPSVSYTVTGDITVNGTFADPNNSHSVIFDGNTTISGTPTLLVIDGATINASKSVTANCNLTLDNTLIGNGTFTSTATVTFTGLTMSGAGTKTLNNVIVGTGTFTPNASYSISGNMTVNGTLVAGNGTTTFNGTTAITGAGAATFNFLTITGSLTSSAGTISVVRDFTNNGTFLHNNGTVSLSTAGTALIRLQGTNSIVFNNLIVNAVGGITPDVTNAIDANRTVDIEGALSFGEANAVIDADGAAGSSVFRFISSADNTAKDGRIAPITFTTSNITGNFIFQRFVSSENRIYRYIASPVVGATVAQLKSALPVTGTFTDPSDENSTPACVDCIKTNPSLFFYNSGTNAYVAFPSSGVSSSAATFTNGTGYSTFFRHTGTGAVGDVTINFRGTNPSTTGVSLPVSAAANGFSLVGNPYPSPIVWDGGAGWAKTNIADVIVVRDNASGVHQSHGTADNFIIAPGQSFWVQSTASGAALTINENAKSTSGNYSFYRTEQPIVDQMELELTKSTSGITDNARISIVSGSSTLYDAFDGTKFDNSIDNGSTVTQVHDISFVSTDASPKMLGIQSIGSLSCSQSFKININDILNDSYPTGTPETSIQYTLSINPGGSFKGVTWILHDSKTNQDIDLSQNPDYQFTVDVIDATAVPIAGGRKRYHLPGRFSLKTVPSSSIDISKSVITPASVCEASEAVITLSSQNGFTYGIEVNGTYYNNVAQGNGNDISLFVASDKLASGPNTIRVKANSGCDSQFLTSTVAINREALYQVSTATDAALCHKGSVTLSAASLGQNATFRWYASETSSDVLGTNAQFATPELSAPATYYVAAVNNQGCEGTRVAVLADVEDVTSQIVVNSGNTVTCKNGVVTFTASSASEGTFKWYETATSVEVIGNQSVYETASLMKTRKYYVSLTTASGCEGPRTEVLAQVSNYSPVLSADNGLSGKQICPQGSYTFTASGAQGNSIYAWFDSNESQEPLIESDQFTTPSLSGSRTYFLAAKNEAGCYSDRVAVEAIVDNAEVKADVSYSYNEICRNDVTTVNLTGLKPNTIYRWYDSEASKIILNEGSTFSTDVIGDKVDYYVAAVNSNGCEGAQRKKVSVDVIQFPDPVINSDGAELASNFEAGNQWYLEEELLAGQTGKTLVVETPGLYNLYVSYKGCSEWASPVLKNTLVTGLEDYSRTIELYPNPVSEVLSVRVLGNEPVKSTLFDARGVEMPVNLKYESGEWRGDLDVRSLSKGMYFLRISSETKVITHKVIIK